MKDKKTVLLTFTESFVLFRMINDPETFAKASFSTDLQAVLGDEAQDHVGDCEIIKTVRASSGWSKRLQAVMPRATGYWLALRCTYQEFKYLINVECKSVQGLSFDEYVRSRMGDARLLNDIAIHFSCEGGMGSTDSVALIAAARQLSFIGG